MQTDPVTKVVKKNNLVNFVHVNIINDTLQAVNIEPPKTDWDLLFTQYGTILYTDDGIPTPYFVRGALINPYEVSASLDYTIPFDSITWDVAMTLDYSNRRNAIGYDWKDVVIDFESNSAEYYVRKDSTWVIRDMEGRYYKMHFLNYYNSNHQVGYPEFEFLEL